MSDFRPLCPPTRLLISLTISFPDGLFKNQITGIITSPSSSPLSFNIDEDLSEMLTVQYSWVQTKLLVLFPDKMSMASMEKHLFNLKFAAKELERNSKKCDKVYNIINISSNP